MNTNTADKLVAITGNTYPVKEKLKALGARWNGADKAWMVSADKAEQARQIVAGAGAKQPYRGARSFGARSSFGRGKWNGCSCGARELPGGGLSANACAQCRFDEYDN